MELSHDEIEQRFDSYREGELSPEEQRAMDDHLAACAPCRESYERFLRTMAALSHLPGARAPTDFVDSVEGQVRRRSRGRFFASRPDWSTRLPYELLSVVMLIAILAVFLFIFLGHGGGAAISH
jgi:anti-sigma factor RsiW